MAFFLGQLTLVRLNKHFLFGEIVILPYLNLVANAAKISSSDVSGMRLVFQDTCAASFRRLENRK
jgi:hypothetical protein